MYQRLIACGKSTQILEPSPYPLPGGEGLSQRDPPMIREPLNADEHQGSHQHVEPQFAPQPIMLGGPGAATFEYGPIHIRETRISQIHCHMNTFVTLSSGV